MKGHLTKDLPLEMASNKYHKDKKLKISKIKVGPPAQRTISYFSSINETIIWKLFNAYKIDFELFRYNIDGLVKKWQNKQGFFDGVVNWKVEKS